MNVIRPEIMGALLLALATPPLSAAARQTSPVSGAAAEAWREDLDAMSRFLIEEHGDVFHSTSEAEFSVAVEALRDRIPRLARHEIIVELQRIAASVGDGHTSVQWLFDRDADFHQLAVRLGWFEEGIFVEAVRDDVGVPPGARVVAIGGVPIEEAIARVTPLVSRDNDFWLRVMVPMLLGSPEVLEAVDLAEGLEAAVLTIERGGDRQDVRVPARAEPFVISHALNAAMPPDWTDVRARADIPPPLWQRNPERLYWYEYLPGGRLLYIHYGAVMQAPEGPDIHTFFADALSVLDERPVDRVVLDIRSNGGGEGTFNTRVVRQFVQRRDLDKPGALFVIIGRRTFSAAQVLAHMMDEWTSAIFVGEPTGSGPQFWGDHRTIELPNSGISVSASPTWWQPGGPYDSRDALFPSLAFEPRFEDFARNRDPVLETLIGWDGHSFALEAPVLTALTAGDTAAAVARVEAWQADPVHRYASAPSELNRVGYRLLRAGRTSEAVRVFRLNVRVHPEYANGWDSLGEALLEAGRHEEGIAAYRRAYALDPEIGNAARVLGKTTTH